MAVAGIEDEVVMAASTGLEFETVIVWLPLVSLVGICGYGLVLTDSTVTTWVWAGIAGGIVAVFSVVAAGGCWAGEGALCERSLFLHAVRRRAFCFKPVIPTSFLR